MATGRDCTEARATPRSRFKQFVEELECTAPGGTATSLSGLERLAKLSCRDVLSLSNAAKSHFSGTKAICGPAQDLVFHVLSKCAPPSLHLGTPKTLWSKIETTRLTCFKKNRRTGEYAERPEYLAKVFEFKRRQSRPKSNVAAQQAKSVTVPSRIDMFLLPVRDGFSAAWLKEMFEREWRK